MLVTKKTPDLRLKVTNKVLSDQYYNYHPEVNILYDHISIKKTLGNISIIARESQV